MAVDGHPLEAAVYIPRHFAVTDVAKLASVMRENSFATLVTCADGAPFASHLPLLFTADGENGAVLEGHMARANPQWQQLAAGGEALAIFAGPHGYISPGWYSQHPSVPTWNYVAVHVYGVATVHEDAAWLASLVRRLTAVYEAGQISPWSPELPPDYERNMLGAIVGFSLAVTRIEGKFKLSQNRSDADRAGVNLALSSSPHADDRKLAQFMAAQGLVPSDA